MRRDQAACGMVERFTARPRWYWLAAVLLSTVLAGCGNDSTSPNSPPPPPPPDSTVGLVEGLWTASGVPAAILRLAPSQLGTSGAPAPATVVVTPSATQLMIAGVAFDRDGTLWISSHDDSLVLGFARGLLESSGSRSASRVLKPTGGVLDSPTGLAFDRKHRLWVVNKTSGVLARFDSATMAAGGTQAPDVWLALAGVPTTIAFDSIGDLWVADHEFHTVTRYSSAQLEASGAPAGHQVLSAANGLAFPAGMAFDKDGNLWIANSGGPNILSFTRAQLAGIGPTAPHVVLSSTGNSLNLPVGLAFDAAGALWVAGAEGSLVKYDPGSLHVSGAPEPGVRLELTGRSQLWTLAFWPVPAGLPLF